MGRANAIKGLIGLGLCVAASLSAAAQSVLKSHDTYQPIDVSAERMEVRDRDGQAVLIGSVEVRQGRMTMGAAQLTIFYEAADDSENPAIRRLDAQGDVRLTSSSESVTSDWGVYDVDRRLITFGGSVTITRDSSVLRGERAELDLVSGLLKVDGQPDGDSGRVRGTFSIPDKKDDTQPDQP